MTKVRIFPKLLQTYNTLPTLRYKLNDKMDNKKLVFLKQLSTFVEDRSLLVEPNRKYDFRLSPNPPFTIFVVYNIKRTLTKKDIFHECFSKPINTYYSLYRRRLVTHFISECRSAYDSFNHRYSHRITQSIRSPHLSIERG